MTYTVPHMLTINFSLVLSDGHTQLQLDTPEVHQQGFQTKGHSPQPGQSQPGGHLYAPEKILDFVSDIEVDSKVACNSLNAGGDPGKRCAFCLFVNNYGGIMSIPMDPPYCLIYSTS